MSHLLSDVPLVGFDNMHLTRDEYELQIAPSIMRAKNYNNIRHRTIHRKKKKKKKQR